MPAPTPDCATNPRRSGALPGSALVAAALLGTVLLAGCETVSLNTPAPVEVLPAASAALPPQSPASAASAAQAPAAQAQGLQASPGVQVLPLAPASAASLPALPASAASPAAPAASGAAAPAPAPASSAPASSAPAAASVPATPASLPASALPPGAVRYVCNDGTSFLASFGDVSVTMSTALGVMELEQTVAADGARYANGEVQVWFKGRQATITNLRSPGSQVLCLEQR